MMYYIGQGMGILATIGCFVNPLFKKKWQMLVATMLVNILLALNLVFIGQVTSAVFLNAVAVIQTILSLWHVQKEKPVTLIENIIFFILYVGCGILGYKTALDLLVIVGAVFNMVAAFERDEQKTRYLLLVNVTLFFIYYLVLGSTSMFAELLAMFTTIIAIFKYGTVKRWSVKVEEVAIMSVISLLVSILDTTIFVALFSGYGLSWLFIILSIISIILPPIAKKLRSAQKKKGRALEIIAIIVGGFNISCMVSYFTPFPIFIGYLGWIGCGIVYKMVH